MMEKVFKFCKCPHVGVHDVGSVPCKLCCYFCRDVGTFIWCSHPMDDRAKEKAENHITVTQKSATRKPVTTKKRDKGNSAKIKKAKSTPKQATVKRKRGIPKKNA